MQKEYNDLLHQEQEIAEKLRDVLHRNAVLLENLEQRTDVNAQKPVVCISSNNDLKLCLPQDQDTSSFDEAYRKWEEDHIKETEVDHGS